MPFIKMRLKLLVSSRTTTTEHLQHETAYWILCGSSTKLEVLMMNLGLVDRDPLALTKIENVFLSLLKKVPKRRAEERRWS